MFNLDDITKEINKEHNEKRPYNPDHPYGILIIERSGSGKTNALLNLISQQDNIDKIYFYTNYLCEPMYEFFIKRRESAVINRLNDQKAFIECSNTMDGVYENIGGNNPSRERKNVIVFVTWLIADIMSNKKFQAVVKKLFLRCRKLNISLVFITQSCFSVPTDVRLHSTHYLIMKIN